MLHRARGKRASEVKSVGGPAPLPVQSPRPFLVPTPALLPSRAGTEQDLGYSSSTQTHLRVPGVRLHQADMAGLREAWPHAGLCPVPAHLGPPSAP